MALSLIGNLASKVLPSAISWVANKLGGNQKGSIGTKVLT